MKESKINLVVVFGGLTIPDEFPVQQKLVQVVRSTLKAAGREAEDPAAWELKDSSGRVLDQNSKINDAGVAAGATLHLVAPAGEGG